MSRKLVHTFRLSQQRHRRSTHRDQTATKNVAQVRFVVKQGLWKFGLHPEQVAGFLAEYGWRECEQVGPDEYADRYLEPAGRTLTASEIERAVYAER